MTQRILAHRHRLITDENSRWWTLGAMCFALFMVMLDNTVVNVSLPSIQRDLHASLSALEWTVNAYTLTFAVLMVTGGRLGDIFGRRRMFLFGVVVFGVSSAAIGFAPNDTTLVAFRAVQGIGAAFMMPATLSIITQAFPPEQRGHGDRHLGRGERDGAGHRPGARRLPHRAGELAGDLLHQPADRRRSRSPSRCSRPASRATRPSAEGSIFAGIAAITVGLTALVLALVEGNTLALGLGPRDRAARGRASSPWPRSCRSSGASSAPMVDFSFFRSRTFLGANLVGLHRLVRDARPVLLPRAVHAEHPPLLAAPGRRALPALDAGDHRHGPARRPADRPHRPAAADDRSGC